MSIVKCSPYRMTCLFYFNSAVVCIYVRLVPYYYYYCVFIWITRSLDHHFGWELHFVVFRLLSPYVVFSWSFFIIFVILLAVSLRSVWSLQNISVLFTFVVLFVGFLYINQVYVLVFQLVRRIYGRLRCCVFAM